jgi:hypothetical protein
LQPLTCVSLDFGDALWQKLNKETSWTLRQISDCTCRPLYRIANWRVHQNSLFLHSEKLTHHHSYCWLIDWTGSEIYYYFICLQAKKKEPTADIFFTFPLLLTQKTGVRSYEIYQSVEGFHGRKSLNKTVRKPVTCYWMKEKCEQSMWCIYIHLHYLEGIKQTMKQRIYGRVCMCLSRLLWR